MALSPAFTIQGVLGFPSQIIVTDTSTGSDGSIAGRRVYLAKVDGTFLVPQGTTTQYIAWLIANASITINALDKDYALLVTVQWVDGSGNVLYSSVQLDGQTNYNETFAYQLTQMMAANPLLVNDNNFMPNVYLLRTLIDAGNQAIVFASDQQNAQLCYDQATNLRTSSQFYFNSNA